MAERAFHSQIPVATFIGRRNAHVPSADQMAICIVDRPLHGLDHGRVGDIVNFDIDGIQGEHADEICKSGTRKIAR